MLFRVKNVHGGPSLRYFVYLSDSKLQMFLEQMGEPARRSIAAELKLDLKLISLTLTSPGVDRSQYAPSRSAKLSVVERYLSRDHSIGDLSSSRGYIAASVEMDWKPCDDNETILFCGYKDKLLVVLNGSVGHLFGHPATPGQVGSYPYTLRAAVRRGSAVDDLAADLGAAALEVHKTPQPTHFLAHAIARGPMPPGGTATEYLLATPLYVEVVDSTAAERASS
jgi:hypothetical protein